MYYSRLQYRKQLHPSGETFGGAIQKKPWLLPRADLPLPFVNREMKTKLLMIALLVTMLGHVSGQSPAPLPETQFIADMFSYE